MSDLSKRTEHRAAPYAAALAELSEKTASLVAPSSSVLFCGEESSHTIRLLRSRKCDVAVAADVAGQPGSYDCVVLENAFGAGRSPARLLSESASALRRGGYVVASFLNASHAAFRLAMLAEGADAAGFGGDDEGRSRPLTMRAFGELLDACGLRLDACERTVARLFDSLPGLPQIDRYDFPEVLMQRVLADAESETGSFVVRAVRDEPLRAVAGATDGMTSVSRALEEQASRIEELAELLRVATADARDERSMTYLVAKLAESESAASRLREELEKSRKAGETDRAALARALRELAQLEDEIRERNGRTLGALRGDLNELQGAIDRIYASPQWRVKVAVGKLRSFLSFRR